MDKTLAQLQAEYTAINQQRKEADKDFRDKLDELDLAMTAKEMEERDK